MKKILLAALAGSLALALTAAEPAKPAQTSPNKGEAAKTAPAHRTGTVRMHRKHRTNQTQKPASQSPAKAAPSK